MIIIKEEDGVMCALLFLHIHCSFLKQGTYITEF